MPHALQVLLTVSNLSSTTLQLQTSRVRESLLFLQKSSLRHLATSPPCPPGIRYWSATHCTHSAAPPLPTTATVQPPSSFGGRHDGLLSYMQMSPTALQARPYVLSPPLPIANKPTDVHSAASVTQAPLRRYALFLHLVHCPLSASQNLQFLSSLHFPLVVVTAVTVVVLIEVWVTVVTVDVVSRCGHVSQRTGHALFNRSALSGSSQSERVRSGSWQSDGSWAPLHSTAHDWHKTGHAFRIGSPKTVGRDAAASWQTAGLY